MRTLESENTKSSSTDESGTSSTIKKPDKDVLPPPSCSPHKKMSLQPTTSTPPRKKPLRSRTQSSSILSPSMSSSLKTPSTISISNGKINSGHSSHTSGHFSHSSHTSGHSSHSSSHNTRSRTISVGSSPHRPNSGHHHKDKKQLTSSNKT